MPQTHTRPIPASGATPSKISVTTASTAILAANADRRVAIVQVLSGGPVYISTGVATANDFAIPTGAVYHHENTAALNGIVATGSADVRVWEEVE